MDIPDYNTFVQPMSWLFYLALSLFFLSIILFETIHKKRYSLFALFLGGLSLFSYISYCYPFLHVWDEQFHALVSKNLGEHFFLPTLLENPILNYDIFGWADTHIWLHKQPFFLWQMALSMKVFGVNTFALRIPDILMASLMPILIYRMGTVIQSKSLGFYAGLLFLTSSFLLKLIPGRLNTDHNDLAFIFYILASFWAWFEYQHSKNKWWLVAIGVFSGIAILVKWVVGLIVYAGWGLSIISDKDSRSHISNYLDMLKSLSLTILVTLPWQIYILWKYPLISRYKYALNTEHFHKVVHGHDGPWYFHMEQWSIHIVEYFNYIVPIGLALFLLLKIKQSYKVAIFSWVVIVSLFFSIAATKMPAFTLIISPLFFIILVVPWSLSWTFIEQNIKFKFKRILIPSLRAGLAIAAFYYMFNMNDLNNNPGWKKAMWKADYAEAITFKKISELELSENSRFYNFYFHGAVRFMFHTPYQARSFLPNIENIKLLKQKGVSIYVFDNGKLPDYIIQDKSITKIKSPIWRDSQFEDLKLYQ